MGSLSPSSSDSQAAGRSATGDPFADQRGFTKTGRGRDEGQFAAETLVQLLDQAGAENYIGPGGGIYSLVARMGMDMDQLLNRNIESLNDHQFTLDRSA